MKLITKPIFDKSTRLLGTIATALALAASDLGAATTIYSDNFSGSGSTTLNGATTTTGGGTWIANTIANRDGTLVALDGSALLAFNPEINKIYTLSMDIAFTQTSRYIFMGFSSNTIASPGASLAADRFNGANQKAYPYMAILSGGTIQSAESNGGTLFDGTSTATVGSVHQYKIVLNTAGDGTSFKASFYFDGDVFASDAVIDYDTVENINYVGFSSRQPTGTVDNFLLTVEPIPEPSAVLLGGISMIALLRRRRN